MDKGGKNLAYFVPVGNYSQACLMWYSMGTLKYWTYCLIKVVTKAGLTVYWIRSC